MKDSACANKFHTYAATKLVDEFGRLHIYEYRDIYGKLVEKSKRMKKC